jgi:hypothetical protein
LAKAIDQRAADLGCSRSDLTREAVLRGLWRHTAETHEVARGPITSTPSPTNESDAEVLDQLVASEAYKPGPNDLRFMSGQSPRRSKEAFGSDYASLAEKQRRDPSPRTAAARVPCDRHKGPKDAATVLSGSRQDEVMENLTRAGFNAEQLASLLARSRSCRAVIRARPEMTKSTPRKPSPKAAP